VHFVRNGPSYLPEIDAYVDFITSHGHQALVHDTGTTVPLNAQVVWWMCGRVPSAEARRLKSAFHIHEYASASAPPYAWLKDFVKHWTQPKPDYRIFQNGWVRERMGFDDGVPYALRDMGVTIMRYPGGNFLSGGTQGTGGNINDINVPAGVTRKPLTAGNRSGNEAIQTDSIDGFIDTNTQGFARGASRAPGILTVNGLLNGTSYQAVMRGLDQKKGIDLMTAPSTVTRSGQQASVRVIRELIYPSEYEAPQLPNSVGIINDPNNGGGGGGNPSPIFAVTPATPSAFEKRDVGVVLDVLPTVSQDKRYVDLQLNPSITDFDGFVNFGSPISSAVESPFPGVAPITQELTANAILLPVFSVKRANTNITIADGATVVIGGLVQERIQKVDDQTPILGDLPLVGRLFQSSATAPVRTSLVFFVNVKLVDPTGKPINQR
jgi:general secretion pathway protein D